MSILLIIGLWLMSWVLIIILSGFATKSYNTDIEKYGEDYIEALSYPTCKEEMLSDGNNLFATGIPYIIALGACLFFQNNILNYICLGAGIIFCIPSIISLFKIIIPQMFALKNKYITLMTISSIISTFAPLGIALNIYFLLIA